MSSDPPMHLLPRPRPRVGEALVVLPPARIEVIDEVLAALPLAVLQAPLCERAEEQLGLIEPGGVRRRDERSHARRAPSQPPRRLVDDVRGAPSQITCTRRARRCSRSNSGKMRRTCLPSFRARQKPRILPVWTTSSVRKFTDARARDLRHESALHRDLRQAARRPMGHVQPEAERIRACQHLDADALQRGKMPGVDPHGERLRRPLPRPLRTDGRGARSSFAPHRVGRSTLARRSLDPPWPAGSALAAPPVTRCVHHGRAARGGPRRRVTVRSRAAVAFASARSRAVCGWACYKPSAVGRGGGIADAPCRSMGAYSLDLRRRI